MRHPAPEVPLRDAWPNEVPRNAAALAFAGRDAGWTVRVTYARGTSMTNRGVAGVVVESIAVRLRRPPQAAVGLWVDSKFSEGWRWRPGESMPTPTSARDLKSHVKEPLT